MQANNFAGLTFPGLNQALHENCAIFVYRLNNGSKNVLISEKYDKDATQVKSNGIIKDDFPNLILALNTANHLYLQSKQCEDHQYNLTLPFGKRFDSCLDWWTSFRGCIDFDFIGTNIQSKLLCNDPQGKFYAVFKTCGDTFEESLITLENWLDSQFINRKIPEMLTPEASLYDYFKDICVDD